MAWKFKDLFSGKESVDRPDADAWFQRGNAFVAQQKWQSALECFQEARRLNPNHSEAHAYAGNVLRLLKQPDAALIAYDQAIACRPDYAEVFYNRGVLLHNLQKSRAALDSYEAALSINPSFKEAHVSRGDVLRELGRLHDALESYKTAIILDVSYWRAHLHLGMLQQQLRQLDEAEASYRQVVVLSPDCADAHFNLGTLLNERGTAVAALASFDAAIAAAPGHVGAHAGRGIALMALGQPEAALASFDTAIHLKPDFARAYGNRAQAQAKLGLLAEARASHEQAVVLDPNDSALHFNFGGFLSDIKEWEQAISSYRTATLLDPQNGNAFCNLGLAQQEVGQWDAALDSYSRAIAINPRLATAFNNRGNVFRSRKCFPEAFLDYRQALALDSSLAEAHFNIGQLALLLGDFGVGWPEYEWRPLIAEAQAFSARTFLQPAWFGESVLEGKQIYVHTEQGLGDTIQFCRYVKLLADLGARVILEVQPPLGELLATLDGVSQLISSGGPIPPADYQCSIMSLPGAFKTTLETIPCQIPYIHAEPEKISGWNEILGRRTRPRIGLAWSGNSRQSNDHNRSFELSRWISYLPDEFEYICLQNEIRDRDRKTLSSFARIATVDSQLKNFTDTAALIETLDLVISVDTSLAHLSGAMGKKTWVLLCYLPDWRWLLDRTDNPWYPTATLYRQPVADDWESVFSEVKKDLLRLLDG